MGLSGSRAWYAVTSGLTNVKAPPGSAIDNRPAGTLVPARLLIAHSLRALAAALRGITAAVRRRPGAFLLITAAVLTLNVMLPPLVLAALRKPWTYFTFNPWLRRLPEFLAGDAPLEKKLDFLSRVALFWFTADGPYGVPEWGFAVDSMDIVRFVVLAVLFGAYAVLWLRARELGPVGGWRATAGKRGGLIGAFAGVIGLSTGPCSVVGCGAPVLPVVGLVFTGLSSGTLAFLSAFSRVSAAAVLVLLGAAVAYLGWQTGPRRWER